MLDSNLQELEVRASTLLDGAASMEALEAARVEFLGRKGALVTVGKEMGKLAPEDRARVGKLLNAVKQNLESRYEARKAAFDRAALDSRLASEWLDLTLPAPGMRPGKLHPVHADSAGDRGAVHLAGIRRASTGPEVETEYYNFDALNIPPDHPARDMQDTFWLSDGTSAAHAHLAGAGPRHAEVRPAAAHDRARPRLPQ